MSASGVALWRLNADANPTQRASVERISNRVMGYLFRALAAYVGYDGTRALFHHRAPHASRLGVALAVGSLIVVPFLAREKRSVGEALASRALVSEAGQTSLCMYLSAILLGGLLLNVIVDWWWSDPVAALVMVPILALEGLEGIRGQPACTDCSS